MHNIGKKEFITGLLQAISLAVFGLFVVGSSIWVCMALWIQQPLGKWLSYALIVLWIIFALSILGIFITQHFVSRRTDMLIYFFAFVVSLFWYFNIPAKQDRDWNPEVSRLLSYQRQGNEVTLYNVRNFDWQPNGSYTEHWETRHYDLNKITGVNVIASYWMGPQIAHTLVSFDFADQDPLTFSIEIRKEKGEDFSAVGGFFRQFELSLVASDEKDIIYTRSNVRKEQVYLFPIKMSKRQAQALFSEYLDTIDELQEKPAWYNTLTSNCTTIVFDMVQAINPNKLPKDYRLLASGYLPNYLYDLNVLDHRYSVPQWYNMAYINDRAATFDQSNDRSSTHFSKTIREGLPKPEMPLE